MSKILITGGSGFIGINLIESFINDGHTVLNVDNSAPANQQHVSLWRDVDILEYEKLNKTITDFNPEVIVHLAAVADLLGTNAEYYSANTKGTQNLIDIAAGLQSLKKVVYTSSMYVCKPGVIPQDFDTYKPHTIYGESKAEGERLVKNIKDVNYEWVIIRPTSIWGPWFKLPYIDFFDIVYQKKYFDFGSACSKTYGYVGNTVYQIKKIIDSENLNGKTFYLGDLPATQISEWANEISIEMKKGPIKKVPFLLLKSAALVGDALKLVGVKFPLTSFRLANMTTNNILPLTNTFELAPQPPYSRLQGIKLTLKWMQDFKGYKF